MSWQKYRMESVPQRLMRDFAGNGPGPWTGFPVDGSWDWKEHEAFM